MLRFLFIVFVFGGILCQGQNEPVKDTTKKLIAVAGHEQDLTFTGTKIVSSPEYGTGQLILGGYISSYYAFYTDSAGANNFQKFPTVSPQSNSFGLNIAQVSAKYTSSKFRSMLTFHAGDIPSSAWSFPQFNYLQEANVGFKLHSKLWFDAGFFRTHIGLESIQPRENITSSLAIVTFFEPYYLSGAKLTFHPTSKITMMAGVFNSFNGFVEKNRNKAIGFSFVYDINKYISLSYNGITSDESPDSSKIKHQRYYNNLFAVIKTSKLIIGVEVNYCLQENSVLNKPDAMAEMFSGLIAVKYKLNKYLSVFARGEIYDDDNEILTGAIVNFDKVPVGLNLVGYTGGFEVKLIPNSYFRTEYRYLQTTTTENIFYYNGKPQNSRQEFQATVGVWF